MNTNINPFGQTAELPDGYPIANNLDTDSAQQALSAAMGKELGDIVASRSVELPTQTSNKQAYGTVGNAIQTGTLNGCSYVFIPKGDCLRVKLTTLSGNSRPSSYMQYVGQNNIIRLLDLTEYEAGTEYTITLDFDSTDIGVYVSYATGTLSIEKVGSLVARVEAIEKRGGQGGASSGFNIMGRGFVDFGTMPSCLATDANNFLPDGVSASEIDSAGNPAALVKYADVVAKYDALVSAYPAYVSKHSFGNDASGTIPMYYYTFKPKYYVQHVYLQAGVHGWEPEAVFALAEIMYLIANAYGGSLAPKVVDNDELKYLRGNVAFTVVPCVNPWGFNRRSDCYVGDASGEGHGGTSKRSVSQNNANGVQLNGAWNGNATEAVYVRTLLDNISSELAFAIDMHTTVWNNTRNKYGCFYGGFNTNGKNVRTIWRTYEWLYEFYGVKYPNIVNGDTCPNVIGNYASVGILTGCFHDWCLNRYGVQAGTMEFSDHVWSEDDSTNYPKPLHTSAAMSVAVNMYLNHILQQVYDGYRIIGETNVPDADKLTTIG